MKVTKTLAKVSKRNNLELMNEYIREGGGEGIVNNDKLHKCEVEGGKPRLVLASLLGLYQGVINVN